MSGKDVIINKQKFIVYQVFIFRLIQKYRVIMRFNKILLVFLKAGFGALIYKFGFHRHINPLRRMGKPEADASILPVKFREALETLGPVFVKFGQILSTRSDILPKEYIIELEKLQSSVAPFPFKDAKGIIEKNFGKPVHILFKRFEEKPFASASLGQVYKAELTTGEKVAVKVQRPKAKQNIKLDTQVLLMLAHLIDKHVPEARGYNLINVVQEFSKWTLNELDYRKEATNCEIFNNFFKEDPNIYAPKIYWDYTRDSVLTLEYVDGWSLKEVITGKAKLGKLTHKQLAHNIADSFVKQFFDYGFFHADPHPGNIFVLENGHILFLDFGMVGFLDDKLTGIGAAAFLAIIQKDVENLVALLLKIEENYDEKADSAEARDLVRINSLRKDLNQLILQWSIGEQSGNFTRLLFEVLSTAVKNGINVPTDMTMLSKAIITLDVVVKQLDREFRMDTWEQPMVEKIIGRKLKGEKIRGRIQNIGLVVEDLIGRLPDSTASIVSNLERGRFGMEINQKQLLDYERLLNANSHASSYGTVLAAVVIASALIYQAKGQPEIWGLSVAQIGLYGSFILIVLYLLSNINNKHHE